MQITPVIAIHMAAALAARLAGGAGGRARAFANFASVVDGEVE